MLKPLLQFRNSIWQCTHKDAVSIHAGFGHTPKQAYDHWLIGCSIKGINIYASSCKLR